LSKLNVWLSNLSNDVFERFSWLLDIDCADLLEDIVDQEYKEDIDELSVEFIIFIFVILINSYLEFQFAIKIISLNIITLEIFLISLLYYQFFHPPLNIYI